MEIGGPNALTLRKCAARAGVSHAAPAHHFGGLISLKVAIIARGHSLFAETMVARHDQATPTARARLIAICEGYIEFAQNHSALFKFMFHPHGEIPENIDAISRDELETASTASYDILHRACLPFAASETDALNTETMVWSLVHGYAMLFVGAEKSPSPADAVPEFASILPKLTLKK